MEGVKKWRSLLMGQDLVILTDHQSLLWLQSAPKLSNKQSRWVSELAPWRPPLFHLKGTTNQFADWLSRSPYEGAQAGAVRFPRGKVGEPGVSWWLMGLSEDSPENDRNKDCSDQDPTRVSKKSSPQHNSNGVYRACLKRPT